MSFKEINELRKSGNLNAAFQRAKEVLEQDNSLWNKRAMSWVLHDLLKQATAGGSVADVLEGLQQVASLELPDDEALFWERIPWICGKLVFDWEEDTRLFSRLDALFAAMRVLPLKRPGPGYSFLLKAFLKKGKSWPHWLSFVAWWDLESLLPEDFEPVTLSNGRKGMAAAEQVIIAVSKHLLGQEAAEEAGQPQVQEQAVRFLPIIQRMAKAHRELQYVQYYLAQLLQHMGQGAEAIRTFLPFARRKKEEYWVWDTLADLYPEQPGIQFACWCKALTCKSEDKYSVKIRRKIIPLLLQRGEQGQAAAQVRILQSAYVREGWHIPPDVLDWLQRPWMQALSDERIRQDYLAVQARPADSLLYADIPVQTILVSSVHPDKPVLYYVNSEKQQGFFNYRGLAEEVVPGMVFNARLVREKDFTRAFDLQVLLEEDAPASLLRRFEGVFRRVLGQGFGFVEDVFIAQALVVSAKLEEAQLVRGTAMLTWDRQKERWGWRASRLG